MYWSLSKVVRLKTQTRSPVIYELNNVSILLYTGDMHGAVAVLDVLLVEVHVREVLNDVASDVIALVLN